VLIAYANLKVAVFQEGPCMSVSLECGFHVNHVSEEEVVVQLDLLSLPQDKNFHHLNGSDKL
jgi:hypothetical protein